MSASHQAVLRGSGIVRFVLVACLWASLTAKSHSLASGLRVNTGGTLQQEENTAAALASASSTETLTKSTLMSPDGEPLSDRHAFTIELHKSAVDAVDQMQFLRQLKMLQIQMREIYASADEESFIQENFVKLTQQVLPEKRLATYYGSIKFGSADGNGQTFPMLFDTGSCEFWVPAIGCQEKTDPAERCDKHTLYDKTKSDSYEDFGDNKLMSIKYLSGAVEGPLARDTVQLGDKLEVTNQVFGMAQEVDVPLLDDVIWDGIIGLAYPNEELAKEGILPLFDNMIQQKMLKHNIFSYYLGINGGAVTFGGIDARYMGDDGTTGEEKAPPAATPASDGKGEVGEGEGGGEDEAAAAAPDGTVEADEIADEMDMGVGTASLSNAPEVVGNGDPIVGAPIVATPMFLEEGEVESEGAKAIMANILSVEAQEQEQEQEQEQVGKVAEGQAAERATNPRQFFNYAKVTDQGYWSIEIVDILLQYGDDEPQATGVCKGRPNDRCTAIVDTGTYLIYGPQDQVNGQLKDVQVNSCEDVKDLPKIIFQMYAGENVTDAKLTLHPHDYVLEFQVASEGSSTDGTAPDCNKAGTEGCESDCVLGLGPDNDEGWTLGQVFLRSFYTVFDRDNNQIGFARANPRA